MANNPETIITAGHNPAETMRDVMTAIGASERLTPPEGHPFISPHLITLPEKRRVEDLTDHHRRALHYKQDFPEMVHFDMTAINDIGEMIGFNPERWIAVIDAAEAAKLPVLVIDSFSHAWEGVGGVLELQAFELDRLVKEAEARANGAYTIDPAKFNQLSWAMPKTRYRRLIDRIVRAKCHLIICTRAKPVMQKGYGQKAENARPTKTRMKNVPWDPASDSDLMFEMTTMVILDPAEKGCPVHQIKVADQFKALLDPRRPMDANTGRAMAEWAMGRGEGRNQKAVLDDARAEARKGADAMRAWWSSADQAKRTLANTILPELQELAANADKQAEKAAGDDPFADSDDAGMTADQRAEMEAAEAAFRSEAAAAE